jgi:hypothetical protein
VAPYLSRCKRFLNECNIYSRHYSPSNSLFLSYSLSNVILNLQDPPKDRADLIEVLGNLPISHLLDPLYSIPKWNARVENYVVSIFWFADLYLARDGCLVFLQWQLHGSKRHQVVSRKLQLQNSFKVCSDQQNASTKFPVKKVNSICIPPRFPLSPCMGFILT